MGKIKIWINGNEKSVIVDSKIRGVVEGLGFKPATVLVERNGKALWPQEYETETLKENDRLEIFRVSAGG